MLAIYVGAGRIHSATQHFKAGECLLCIFGPVNDEVNNFLLKNCRHDGEGNQKAKSSNVLITFWASERSPKNEVMYQLLSNVLIHKLYISRKLLHLLGMMRMEAEVENAEREKGREGETRCKRLTVICRVMISLDSGGNFSNLLLGLVV